MTMANIRRAYRVPAKRGGRVEWTTRQGTRRGKITSATHCLWVRFDGERYPTALHPLDDMLVYLSAEEQNDESNS